MTLEVLRSNLVSPPVLFFALGVIATLLRSHLSFPEAVTKFLSLYLLMAIGFKGGVELAQGGVNGYAAVCLLAAIAMATLVPLYSVLLFRRVVDPANAAALAATYGSVSAVTFIAAIEFLTQRGEAFSGHMIAAMALMESPAIVVGVLLVRMRANGQTRRGGTAGIGGVLKEGMFNGSVMLLLGSMAIGAVASEKAVADLQPFTSGLFTGMLCLFLLDMGITAAERFGAVREAGVALPVLGVALPIVNGLVAAFVAFFIGMTPGDALLFSVLSASASYIAVPAAMRMAVPEASPSLYVTMALAVTFPFNVAIGIPLFWTVTQWLGSG